MGPDLIKWTFLGEDDYGADTELRDYGRVGEKLTMQKPRRQVSEDINPLGNFISNLYFTDLL